MVKSCAICKNIRFEASTPGYSEYTPGGDASFYCALGIGIPDINDSDNLFTDLIEIAGMCKKFDPEKIDNE